MKAQKECSLEDQRVRAIPRVIGKCGAGRASFLGFCAAYPLCLVLYGGTITLILHMCSKGESLEFDLSHYHDLPDFETYLHEAAQQYPHIAQLKSIGETREGRKLLGLKIGAPTSRVDKPAIWIDGGNHAREWPAFHLAIHFIELLLNGHGVDAEITRYLNQLNFYIFPVLNPDGFVFSRSSTKDVVRQWRKNRAPLNCSGMVTPLSKQKSCCEGVDLNRNWDVAFSQENYPFNNPCSDEFQGPKPFSEPETRAMRDFLLSREINGQVKAMVSMHTHGQLLLLPYNYRQKTYPPDYSDLLSLARRTAAAISSLRGTEYQVGTAPDLLGMPATGGTIDWVKNHTSIKYVYVMELPPELTTWFAFQMRPHWLIPTAKETWNGIKIIVDQRFSTFAQILRTYRGGALGSIPLAAGYNLIIRLASQESNAHVVPPLQEANNDIVHLCATPVTTLLFASVAICFAALCMRDVCPLRRMLASVGSNLTFAELALLCPALLNIMGRMEVPLAGNASAVISATTSTTIHPQDALDPRSPPHLLHDLMALWEQPECRDAVLKSLDQEESETLPKAKLLHQQLESANRPKSGNREMKQLASQLTAPVESGSEDYEENLLDYDLRTRVIMTLVFTSLTIIGVIGNLLVVLVVKKVPGMLSPTNCYLVSLAVSDCMFFLATTPTELQYLHVPSNEYIFGEMGCAFLSYLPYLAINTSSLSITAFTVERFIGICYPLRARYICTVKRAKLIILTLWTFSILYNSPWLYLATVIERPGQGRLCDFKLDRDSFAYKIMYLGDFATFYLIPMVLYVYIYGKITYTLSRSGLKSPEALALSTHNGSAGFPTSAEHTNAIPTKQRKSTTALGSTTASAREYHVSAGGGDTGKKSSIRGKMQVIKMLAVVVIIFAVCWLPYRGMVLFNSFSDEAVRFYPDWYIFFAKTLVCVNCAINPVLYSVMSLRFRNAFKRLLRGETAKHRSLLFTHNYTPSANKACSLHSPGVIPPAITSAGRRDSKHHSTAQRQNICIANGDGTDGEAEPLAGKNKAFQKISM